jgi:hypothetical protein
MFPVKKILHLIEVMKYETEDPTRDDRLISPQLAPSSKQLLSNRGSGGETNLDEVSDLMSAASLVGQEGH